MKEPKVTSSLVSQHGLSKKEYRQIIKILGRKPNFTELGIFSVMWSEHCSYKSSKVYLKRLPTEGKHVIQGPGENAGVIDIGAGMAAVFKMESHNHPSFIEPYQGAATGVGGILRDIFTMGARPIALLDSLRFGPLEKAKNRYLFGGVVAGIAGYGNCMGVPTIGGEAYFSDTYNNNCLVNVFCLGIAKKNRIFKGRATGIGNPVIYVGSKTGRDGIHGATMASEEFGEGSEERRPTVQVGDPFTEKLLLEACLELMKHDLIIGIQDMGAAGLTSSSCEMASRGGTGIELNLDMVPRREEGMIPYEVMLSESQERMLIVAKKGKEKRVEEIFKKWDLEVATIGHVTGDRMLRVKEKGEIVAKIPAKALAEKAPKYRRPIKRPAYLKELTSLKLKDIPEPDDYNKTLRYLLSSPTIASKEWVYQQYDHMVRTNTLILPGSDAAIVRIKGTKKALAMTVDCNSLYCYLDPYNGGMIAVAEAARNLVCAGARPMALTDCLNFGSPERPEIMWQFKRAIEGIRKASIALNTPVVSGNVSFYNETSGIAIFPTPVIGMVGLIEDVEKRVTQGFKNDGDLIVLLGINSEEIGSTEYLKWVHKIEAGRSPEINLAVEKKVQKTCLEAINLGIVKSAHDCSEGGLAIAIAEGCIYEEGKNIGAEVKLTENMRKDALLFGESQSRIILSIQEDRIEELKKIISKHMVPARIIGKVGGDRLIIKKGKESLIDLSLKDIEQAWRRAIPEIMV